MTSKLATLALTASLSFGSAGMLIGCDDEVVSSKEKTTVQSDGDMKKTTETTKVDRDDGTVKKETTVEKKEGVNP